jgi:hypothetical protein
MAKRHPTLLGIVTAVIMFSISYPAHPQQITASPPVPEIPETIFATGDIAKCDGEDPWWEEFLELVGLLPESPGEERDGGAHTQRAS